MNQYIVDVNEAGQLVGQPIPYPSPAEAILQNQASTSEMLEKISSDVENLQIIGGLLGGFIVMMTFVLVAMIVVQIYKNKKSITQQ